MIFSRHMNNDIYLDTAFQDMYESVKFSKGIIRFQEGLHLGFFFYSEDDNSICLVYQDKFKDKVSLEIRKRFLVPVTIPCIADNWKSLTIDSYLSEINEVFQNKVTQASRPSLSMN